MSSPSTRLNPTTWTRLLGTFETWVAADDLRSYPAFGQAGAPALQPLHSVAQMIGHLATYHLHRPLHDETGPIKGPLPLHMSVQALCRLRLDTAQAGLHPVQILLERGVCAPALEHLMFHEDCSKEFQHLAAQPAELGRVAQALATQLLAQVGARTLESFFMAQRGPNGYLTWHEEFFGHSDVALAPQKVKTQFGTVTVEVGRHIPECRGDVTPYEWQATLRRREDSQAPDAVACGMLYVAPRKEGLANVSASQLRWSADEVSDVDVALMLALLDQHPDSPELVAHADLCFLSIWERQPEAPAGAGAAVLAAALSCLKKKFRKTGVLAVDLAPAPFLPIGLESEPAALQVRRAEARESLERYLQRLQPETVIQGQLRLIASMPRSPDETLYELGARDLRE